MSSSEFRIKPRRSLHSTPEKNINRPPITQKIQHHHSQSSGEEDSSPEHSEFEASHEDASKEMDACNSSQSDNTRSYRESSFETAPGNSSSSSSANKSFPGSNITVLLLFGSLSVIVAGCAFFHTKEVVIEEDNNEAKHCPFDLLKKEFPMEDEMLWKSLQVGIESVLNNQPPYPAIYLFLHQENSRSRQLIMKIAKTAAACFNPTLEPVEFGSKDFNTEETINDYGVIVNKFATKVRNGGTLIVANLNEIPGKSARALHAICDTYNPVVRNVVIFMTLVTSVEQVGKPTEIAEGILLNLWESSMGKNELYALIARITDQVFKLNSK